MPKVNETWALAKSTVNYFCRLMNGAQFFYELLHGDTGCPRSQSILRVGILFTYREDWSYAGQAAL